MSLITTLLYPKPFRPAPLLRAGEAVGNVRNITSERPKQPAKPRRGPSRKDFLDESGPHIKEGIMRERHAHAVRNSKAILAALTKLGEASRRMIEAETKLSSTTVCSRLRYLREMGAIDRSGGNNNRTYKLVE